MDWRGLCILTICLTDYANMCILGKEDMIAVQDLWKVTDVKNINLEDLAGLSPKFITTPY